MFAVDHVLVSDSLLDAPFACNLGACLGGCCVQGTAGAPLESDEREVLEQAYGRVEHLLTPQARATVAREGVWEETAPGHYNTTCVEGGQCVFVTFEGAVAKCALQKMHAAGKLDFPKPLSCHLYPIRVEQYDGLEVLNYEQIGLCRPARRHGARLGVQVADVLEEPLTRRYGAAWYARFRHALARRRADLGLPDPATPRP